MSRDPLWRRLVDDAAVFPPGNAPWSRALPDHRAHRISPYGPMVGPLLVPAKQASAIVAALGSSADPLEIGLIGPVDAIAAARDELQQSSSPVEVVAAEIPPVGADELASTVTAAQRLDVPALWFEVPWGEAGVDAVAALATASSHVRVGRSPFGAKLRTGGTTAAAVVPIEDLALFLRACTSSGVPFKLTAGLHHAVRGEDPVTGGITHGVLNVVAAVDALLRGAEDSAVKDLLSLTDPSGLVPAVTAIPDQGRRTVRQHWASFGCCGVADPLRELADLGVLPADGLTGPSRATVPAPLTEEVP